MTPEQIRDNFNLFVTMVMTDKTVKIVARNKELEARVKTLEQKVESLYLMVKDCDEAIRQMRTPNARYTEYEARMRREEEARRMEQRAYRIISEMPSFIEMIKAPSPP